MSKKSFRKLFVPLLGWSARSVISILTLTLRIKIHNNDEFQKIKKLRESKQPIMIALWHNRLILLAQILRKTLPQLPFTILISKSRDGDFPAAFAKTYNNIKVIRVAHTGRHIALHQSIDSLKHGEVLVITPDGPRGPCYSLKPGAIFSAQKSGAFVFPISWKASRYWKLNTWDGLMIPYPFSRIDVTFHPPLQFSKECDLSDAEKILQKALS